ncbi:MAG: non-homologous end-joining DNA ligase [Chloroflexota bacterium]
MAGMKSSSALELEGRRVAVTNREKVLFPEDGFTKGDVVDYYQRIAPYLLPVIADRPMSMHPFPDGITGKRFWQKDVPTYAPPWLRVFRYEALEASKVLRWGLINDLPSLVWVANHASLELHPWSSRYDKPEYPDWAIFDLDPSEPAGFEECRAIARLLRVVLDRLELRSCIKTTGQRGLQIYVPIVRQYTYAQVREWVLAVALLIARARPDIVTMEWDKSRRGGKVRIDYTQMVIGKTLVAPYAIRPHNGAPVSTPIAWEELDDPELRPNRWNICSIFQRLQEKGDLFAPALRFDQELPALGGEEGARTAAGAQRAVTQAQPRTIFVPPSDAPAVASADVPASVRHEPAAGASANPPAAEDKLAPYHRKRRFNVTPEPVGTVQPPAGPALRFCVQKHRASHLHYDFRLEAEGVLRSWAVPRGPSLDPGDKRLAMQVEDHPLEYMEFEGSIPKAEYGGGTVMLWDVGTYQEQPGSHDGDLKFVLHGHKLRGEFALVRMHGKGKEWLLIKKRDEAAGSPVDDEHSVKSGRTMEEIAASVDAVWLSDLPAAAAEIDYALLPEVPLPRVIEPMLASLAPKPFSDPDWLFEPKWDGIRAIALVSQGKVRLLSRHGNDLTAQYPELASLAAGLAADQAALDGEIVAYDDRGLPNFHTLQRRMNLTAKSEIERIRQEIPVAYQAFDLLHLNGHDLMGLPLIQRKALLRRTILPHAFIFFCGHVEERGEAFFQGAIEQGLEGMVAKLKRSPYLPGKRSRSWLKLKGVQTVDCVVGGWTDGQGARKELGALALGMYLPTGRLRYITNCGSGFDDASLRQTLELLRAGQQPDMPFDAPPDAPGHYHWTDPRQVCEVKFSNWTPDAHLRHPVFVRLRPDKQPGECLLAEAHPEAAAIAAVREARMSRV